jgi:hypothetical protein
MGECVCLGVTSTFDNCKVLATLIQGIWAKAGIPAIKCSATLAKRIQKLYSDANEFKKTTTNCSTSYMKRKEEYEEKLAKLFDIAACKCTNFNDCYCSIEKKTPLMEQDFLRDQRSERKLVIGPIDVCTSKNLKRKLKIQVSKQKGFNFEEKMEVNIDSSCVTPATPRRQNAVCGPSGSANRTLATEASVAPLPSADVSYSTPRSQKSTTPRVKLTAVSKIADRYSVSDTVAAALCSAAVLDLGCNEQVFDRNKIRRERAKVRSRSQEGLTTDITSLYFDGKKDITNVQEGNSKRRINEEHISLIAEPDSEYMGHVTPASGTAEDITQSIIHFFNEKNIDGTAIHVRK